MTEEMGLAVTRACSAARLSRAAYYRAGSNRAERFNRSFRNEVLDAHIFEPIADAREIAEDWLQRYNEIRPHDSLGRLPPAKYREKIIAEQSSLELPT